MSKTIFEMTTEEYVNYVVELAGAKSIEQLELEHVTLTKQLDAINRTIEGFNAVIEKLNGRMS